MPTGRLAVQATAIASSSGEPRGRSPRRSNARHTRVPGRRPRISRFARTPLGIDQVETVAVAGAGDGRNLVGRNAGLVDALRTAAAVACHSASASNSTQPGQGASDSVLHAATANSRPSCATIAALATVPPLSIPSRYISLTIKVLGRPSDFFPKRACRTTASYLITIGKPTIPAAALRDPTLPLASGPGA